MQLTDLVLRVLAQFPESPGGCHFDRRRGEEHHGRLRNRARGDGQSGVCGARNEEEARGAFKALPGDVTHASLQCCCHTPISEISGCCHFWSVSEEVISEIHKVEK